MYVCMYVCMQNIDLYSVASLDNP